MCTCVLLPLYTHHTHTHTPRAHAHTYTYVHRPLHFHALRLIPAHSRLLTFDEYTCEQTHMYVRSYVHAYVIRTCTRWAPHKLTSLSRVARLLLALRIIRLHNGGGRSARFSSARELLTFPGFATLRSNATHRVCARARTPSSRIFSTSKTFFFLKKWYLKFEKCTNEAWWSTNLLYSF